MTHDAETTARRALLRDTIGGLSSLLALSKLSGCSDAPDAPETPRRPAANTPAPASPSPSAGTTGAGAAGTAPIPPPNAPSMKAPGAEPVKTVRAAQPASAPSTASSSQIACSAPATFPAISDTAPRAGFAHMDQGDQWEWLTVGLSATAYAELHPDTVLHMLRLLDGVHAGYPLSVLAHSLQAATRARRANASDELVLCALCHHLGMALNFEGHAEISAAILRGFVSEDAYRVVRHQDEFQRLHYGALLDEPTDQRDRYTEEPWFEPASRFCDEWDSPSYARDYVSLPLEEFAPLVRAKLGTASGFLASKLTMQDCIPGSKS